MCNKVTYNSKNEALKDAKLLYSNMKHFSKRKGNHPVKRMKPYECKRCGKWHLTSKKKRKY